MVVSLWGVFLLKTFSKSSKLPGGCFSQGARLWGDGRFATLLGRRGAIMKWTGLWLVLGMGLAPVPTLAFDGPPVAKQRVELLSDELEAADGWRSLAHAFEGDSFLAVVAHRARFRPLSAVVGRAYRSPTAYCTTPSGWALFP
mgnify:CR=1 FL=1